MDKHFPEPRISGVFSQRTVATIGTGATVKRTESLAYFSVRELEDGMLEVQTLGPNNEPVGKKQRISRDDLLDTYLPEPQRSIEFANRDALRQQEVTRHVAKGDKYLKRGENYSAEYEYSKALALDEENVRANFGIGLCYLAREDQEKARVVFERLVVIDAAFRDEHKHLFNEFGIRLRMSGMHEEALGFYSRAVELSPSDENLHYNMARAAFDKGQPVLASQHLCDCLRLNPMHPEATQFMDFLKRKGLLGAACK